MSHFLLFLLVLCISTAWCGKSLVTLKKRNDGLLSKLDTVHQRNNEMKKYRGPWVQNSATANNYTLPTQTLFIDDDVMEAIIMRTLIIRIFELSERTLKLSSHAIRVSGDTAAGLLSSLMRGVGGIMNVFASLLANMSDKVDSGIPKDANGKAITTGDTRVNLVTTLKNVARLFFGFSHACIWGGEITESLTLGLGEAVQDSFKGLELLTRTGNRLINYIFLNDFVEDDASTSLPLQPYIKPPPTLAQTINDMPNVVIETDVVNDGKSYGFERTLEEEEARRGNQHCGKSAGGTGFSSMSKDSPSLPSDENDPPRPSIRDSRSHQPSHSPRAEDEDIQHVLLHIGHSILSLCESIYSATMAYAQSVQGQLMTQYQRLVEDGEFEIEIMGVQLLLVFAVIFAISFLDFRSNRSKAYVISSIMLLCWLSILCVEYSQRSRLVTRTASKAVESYLAQKVEGFSYHPDNLIEDEATTEAGEMQVFSLPNQVWAKLTDDERAHAENIAWVNILMSSLWTVYDKQLDIGGLGTYTNDMYEEWLTAELSNIPPGVANLRMKRFDFGTNPPFVKGMKSFVYRNQSCIRQLEDALWKEHAKHQHHHQHPFGSFTGRDAEGPPSRSDRQKGRPNSLRERLRAWEAQLHSSTSEYSTVVEKLLRRFVTKTTSHHHSHRTKKSTATVEAHEQPHHQDQHAHAHEQQPASIFDHFSIECDRLYLDLDVLYASKDMDIALSLRYVHHASARIDNVFGYPLTCV